MPEQKSGDLYQRVEALEQTTAKHGEALQELRDSIAGTPSAPGLRDTVFSTRSCVERIEDRFEKLDAKIMPILEERLKIKGILLAFTALGAVIAWVASVMK